jgi:hypothetical protein
MLVRMYFACALGEARKDVKVIAFYDAVADFVAETPEIEGYFPHLHPLPQGVGAVFVNEHSMGEVENSDVLVLYGGIPSLGAGQEFEYATCRMIPTIIIIEEGKELDPMTEGAATEVVRFSDLEELRERLIGKIIALAAL